MAKTEITNQSAVDFDLFKPVDPEIAGLYEQLVNKATSTIAWYANERRYMRVRTLWIRRTAVLALGASAGLVALQAGNFPISIPALHGVPPIPTNVLELVFAGLGSGVLVLDKLFGYSTGWVRYMLAELAVQRALDDFKVDWTIATMAQKQAGTPAGAPVAPPAPQPPSGVAVLQQLLKAFSAKVDSIVGDETQQWVIEFQSSMALLQKSAKDAQPASVYGSISLTVSRGTGVDPDIVVEIDGQKRAETTARTIVLSNVLAGIHGIKVTGKNAGNTVENSAAVTVTANSVVSVQVSLP
ncbi:MAG: SLATT domain-containing protein [Alphaproteobacteria bacterium]|nr:SLATT domain-containing protein [Alphaproteobacteria bacterium]